MNGPDKALQNSLLPSRLSVVAQLARKGKLIGGSVLSSMLKSSARSVFPAGAPI
jgi:hypothetical protein